MELAEAAREHFGEFMVERGRIGFEVGLATMSRADVTVQRFDMRSPILAQVREYAGLLVVVIAVLVANSILANTLVHESFFSGWVLVVLVIALMALNVRKKLAFLPLGSMAGWMRLHIRWGLLSGVVFLMHAGIRLPQGMFESILHVLFTTVFLSGLVGWGLSRSIPRRLTARGEEVIFERIPMFMHRIRTEVEALVEKTAADPDTSALPEFYRTRLQPFFQEPRNMLRHVLHSQQPRQVLLHDIEGQRRFLNDKESEAADIIEQKVRIKDDLDYHYALQLTLKIWLFVHVPLSYSLSILVVFHVLAVYAFLG